MKTLPLSLTLLAISAAPLLAQTAPTTTHAPVHHTVPAKPVAPAVPVCVKEPELSPKIPALPADAPCAKHLYSITTIPSVKLENVSPMETKDLAQKLGIEPSTFSLDYIDTKIGDGPLAEPKKWYSIHYTGYLLDGTKFDSSVDRGEPIVIPYGGHQVIPGWDTGFDGMHVGGKRRLFIPFQLAYGAQGKPPVIPERAELVFDVELVAQSDEKPAPKTPPAPAPATAPASQPAAAPAGTPPASAPAPKPAAPVTTPAAPAGTPAPKPAAPATTPPATTPPATAPKQ